MKKKNLSNQLLFKIKTQWGAGILKLFLMELLLKFSFFNFKNTIFNVYVLIFDHFHYILYYHIIYLYICTFIKERGEKIKL